MKNLFIVVRLYHRQYGNHIVVIETDGKDVQNDILEYAFNNDIAYTNNIIYSIHSNVIDASRAQINAYDKRLRSAK